MSNVDFPSSENKKSVRWRMKLPPDLLDVITALAIDEERDPGDIAARWLIRYWKEKYSTEKEKTSG